MSKQTAKQAFLAANQKDGERYCGLILGENGEPDYHLFEMFCSDETMTWQQAADLAKARGGKLADRQEGRLLAANARIKNKEGAFWLKEPRVEYSDSAWCQFFYDGHQGCYYEDGKLACRAVRRVYLEVER